MQGVDRRQFMRKAGIAAGAAGALWVSPTVDRFVSPAAAASGSVGNVALYKATSGQNSTTVAALCPTGAGTTVGRGSVTFTRTEVPTPTISVTISISSGPDNVGRELYILQSTSSGTCIGGTLTPVGTWAASPKNGPQTFSAPIVTGATYFVVLLWQSGGGGTDASATPLVNLP